MPHGRPSRFRRRRRCHRGRHRRCRRRRRRCGCCRRRTVAVTLSPTVKNAEHKSPQMVNSNIRGEGGGIKMLVIRVQKLKLIFLCLRTCAAGNQLQLLTKHDQL